VAVPSRCAPSIMGAIQLCDHDPAHAGRPGMSPVRMRSSAGRRSRPRSFIVGLPASPGGALMFVVLTCVGTSFYRPEGGGDPVLYRTLLLGFYSTPRLCVSCRCSGCSPSCFPVYAQSPLFRAIACGDWPSLDDCGAELVASGCTTCSPAACPSWMRDLVHGHPHGSAVPTASGVRLARHTLGAGKLRLNTRMLFASAPGSTSWVCRRHRTSAWPRWPGWTSMSNNTYFGGREAAFH